MRVADLIFQEVRKHVNTVFFIPGGGASFLVDALGQSGLRYVACLHEQGAGYAAVSYAMYKGLGVCLTTSGPGATNAITPCLGAWMDSVPVLFISGQVATRQMSYGQRTLGTQEGPTEDLVRPITKKVALLWNADKAGDVVRDLIAEAKQGRAGPVWLDVPQDIQGKEFGL